LEDDALIARLASEQIPLTVCPLSNLKLCIVDDRTHHPLKEILDTELLVTVNSANPPYFDGYLNENFHTVVSVRQLVGQDITPLINHSLVATFLSQSCSIQSALELLSYSAYTFLINANAELSCITNLVFPTQTMKPEKQSAV